MTIGATGPKISVRTISASGATFVRTRTGMNAPGEPLGQEDSAHTTAPPATAPSTRALILSRACVVTMGPIWFALSARGGPTLRSRTTAENFSVNSWATSWWT